MIFYTHERNFGCRISEYVYRGLPTVTLENELLRVTILAGKGGDIFEFLYKPRDVDFMWRSPWGVRDPATFVATSATPGSAFLDFYEGGWQDCLPTGGDPCVYQGWPFGAHGETPTMPWQYRIVEDTPESVAVTLWARTYRTPFYVTKTLSLARNRAALTIDETVTNEGRTPMDLFWGQHPALGAPFIDDSCRIDLPGGQTIVAGPGPNSRYAPGSYTWPQINGRDGTEIDLRAVPEADADSTDVLRLTGLPEGWYAVTNTRRQVGFGMAWPLEVFPALWYWQVFGGAYGPPWYGRTYNIALEPFSSPQATLPEAIAAGTAHHLLPGAMLHARFVAVAFEGPAGVQRIGTDGTVEKSA